MIFFIFSALSLIAFMICICIYNSNTSIFGMHETGTPGWTYDRYGVPSYDYGGLGVHQNPLFAAAEVIYHSQRGTQNDREIALNNANWLISHSLEKGNSSLLVFDFPQPRYNLGTPWLSAMAQARAMISMLDAFDLTHNSTYMEHAKQFMSPLFMEVKDGGVTYKSNNDWWYEEYAGTNGSQPRVLNGMMAVLRDLATYYNHTHDEQAKFLYERGISALRSSIAQYDVDRVPFQGYSFYDSFGKPASESYHEYHVGLLARILKTTDDDVLRKYYEKWDSYSGPYLKPLEPDGQVVLDPKLELTQIIRGLDNPIDMSFIGPDDILVGLKKSGIILRVSNETVLPEALLDLNVANANNRGILGLTSYKNDTKTYAILDFIISPGVRDGDDVRNGEEPLGRFIYRYDLIENKLYNPDMLLYINSTDLNSGNYSTSQIQIGSDNRLYLLYSSINMDQHAFDDSQSEMISIPFYRNINGNEMKHVSYDNYFHENTSGGINSSNLQEGLTNITATKFFNSSLYGSMYQDNLFIATYASGHGILYHLDTRDHNNKFEGQRPRLLISGLGEITDIEIGADGNLYLLQASDPGIIYRISPSGI